MEWVTEMGQELGWDDFQGLHLYVGVVKHQSILFLLSSSLEIPGRGSKFYGGTGSSESICTSTEIPTWVSTPSTRAKQIADDWYKSQTASILFFFLFLNGKFPWMARPQLAKDTSRTGSQLQRVIWPRGHRSDLGREGKAQNVLLLRFNSIKILILYR